MSEQEALLHWEVRQKCYKLQGKHEWVGPFLICDVFLDCFKVHEYMCSLKQDMPWNAEKCQDVNTVQIYKILI